MKDFPIVQKTVKSADGTKIGYQVIGGQGPCRGEAPCRGQGPSQRSGPKTIILCNGLGGTAVAWKPLYSQFADRYRFVTWDYRGLFSSDPPSDEARMTISDHVADLSAIVKKEKISKAVVAGWSMGVQVCLESYRTLSPIFEGMILLNGTYGNPFDTALNNPLSRYILPKVNELAQRIVPAVQPAIKPLANRLIDWKGLVGLIAKLGLVHENLNSEIFQEVARGMLQTDLKMYHEIMSHLSEHDASDLLPKIKVPTLIMAGDSDLLTPMKVAEKMAREIPNAQLLIVPGGTHYCILEFPEIINLRVEKFLGELASP